MSLLRPRTYANVGVMLGVAVTVVVATNAQAGETDDGEVGGGDEDEGTTNAQLAWRVYMVLVRMAQVVNLLIFIVWLRATTSPAEWSDLKRTMFMLMFPRQAPPPRFAFTRVRARARARARARTCTWEGPVLVAAFSANKGPGPVVGECIACMENRRLYCFEACGHAPCICHECAHKLVVLVQGGSGRIACPLCRTTCVVFTSNGPAAFPGTTIDSVA